MASYGRDEKRRREMAENEERAIATTPAIRRKYTAEEIELMKQTVAKDTTDLELQLFLHQCERTGLDPFNRQIHAIKRWHSSQKKQVMTMQVGIDGFRVIAARPGDYAPGREPTFTYDPDGEVISATAYGWKCVKGKWFEVSATAFYDEYVQLTKAGKPNRMWGKMPRVMLAKCAEAQMLRKVNPQDLSGLYTHAEMMQAGPSTSEEVLAEAEDGKLIILAEAKELPKEQAPPAPKAEAEAVAEAFPQAKVKQVSLRQEERWAAGIKKLAEEGGYSEEGIADLLKRWAAAPRTEGRYQAALTHIEAAVIKEE